MSKYLLTVLLAGLLPTVSVLAQPTEDLSAAEAYPDAYAQLQNCFAKAVELADNGSYERFCMAQYEAELQQMREGNEGR